MDIKTLDFVFPFITFSYGILVITAHELAYHKKLIPQYGNSLLMQHLYEQLRAHKPLAWICFFAGGLWSLQNLWYSLSI